MGQIGKFIDAVCQTHPPLMRAVLEQPLSPLKFFIDFDRATGKACGCLIGTAAIAAGFQPEEDNCCGVVEDVYQIDSECRTSYDFLSEVLGEGADHLYDVGIRVNDLSCRIAGMYTTTHGTPASDARTVHLIRQRIARQLAVRESALGVGAPRLPHEPVECAVPSPTVTA